MNLPDEYYQAMYASADFLDADAVRPAEVADTALMPLGDGFGKMSVAVQNLIRKHTSEIRDGSGLVANTTHQVRRSLREFFIRYQDTLFKFLEKPIGDIESVASYNKIMARFGGPDFNISRSTIHDLTVDLSGETVLADLETQLEFRLDEFGTDFSKFLKVLKDIADEIMRLETELKTKGAAVDLLVQNVQGVLTLSNKNQVYADVVTATEKYIAEAIRNNAIEATYKSLIGEYKKLGLLRDAFMGARLCAAAAATEPLCSVCVSDPVNYTFAPCGHTFCQGCMRKQAIQCFICRQPIRERVKLYFS